MLFRKTVPVSEEGLVSRCPWEGTSTRVDRRREEVREPKTKRVFKGWYRIRLSSLSSLSRVPSGEGPIDGDVTRGSRRTHTY